VLALAEAGEPLDRTDDAAADRHDDARTTHMMQSGPDGVTIDIRVIPRASKSGVSGTRGDAVLVRLHAPPVEGAANAELIRVIAAALAVPTRAVSIVAGERSRQKRVRVSGIDAATVASRLATPAD
jgi:uncharacterized protein (TIGR00251 family)